MNLRVCVNSKDNRRTLALGNGKYILGARMRAGDEVTHEVLARAGRYKEVKDNLRVKEVIVGDGARQRRYIVCHNPLEVTRQRAHRTKVVAELEAELASMKQSLAGGHSKRACELLASGRYGKYLRQLASGALRLDRTAIQEAERYDGKWVVTSNDDTLTAEDLALGYKQLLRVEHGWRQMKSGLRCDPSFTSGLGGSRLMSRSPCSLCSSNASPRSAPARPGATSWGRCLPLVRGR